MPSHQEDKPCRACTDFKTWAKNQNKKEFKESPKAKVTKAPTSEGSDSSKGCPLDKTELGRQTWGFLHTMAAYYPEKPSMGQCADMARFLNIFAQFYPCDYCAEDMRADIKKHPPKTKSRHELEQWLCERHNAVNAKLNKPLFDCSTVHERWREGWKDGSCD